MYFTAILLLNELQVMSNVKNIKASITQLLTVSKVKFTGITQDQYSLLDHLQETGAESFRVIRDLNAKVRLP